MTLVLVLLTIAAGCRVIEERIIYDSPPALAPAAPVPSAPPGAEIIERRFVNPEAQSDAVQSAVTWAKKYEQIVEQNTELREKHNLLVLQNGQLTRRVEEAAAELERTRKELNEANVFIQEMHVELNKWKTDVLGFREEMRLAQKAQLEALSRILQVLGAEAIRMPGTLKKIFLVRFTRTAKIK
jgi:septal ring factor EnvC (AmiA/AmiB activator)